MSFGKQAAGSCCGGSMPPAFIDNTKLFQPKSCIAALIMPRLLHFRNTVMKRVSQDMHAFAAHCDDERARRLVEGWRIARLITQAMQPDQFAARCQSTFRHYSGLRTCFQRVACGTIAQRCDPYTDDLHAGEKTRRTGDRTLSDPAKREMLDCRPANLSIALRRRVLK